METPTQVQLSISAAYDSVNLINKLKAQEVVTEEELNYLEKNKKHIVTMLGKDWFAEGLTPEQKSELETIAK